MVFWRQEAPGKNGKRAAGGRLNRDGIHGFWFDETWFTVDKNIERTAPNVAPNQTGFEAGLARPHPHLCTACSALILGVTFAPPESRITTPIIQQQEPSSPMRANPKVSVSLNVKTSMRADHRGCWFEKANSHKGECQIVESS